MRVLGILLLVFEVGIGFAYGFGAQFDTRTSLYSPDADNSSALIFYMLPAILALLGWGLIIAYS